MNDSESQPRKYSVHALLYTVLLGLQPLLIDWSCYQLGVYYDVTDEL